MTTSMTLGWEEWVSLPDLGLHAIKTKIDTGARTSALHAVAVEPFGSESNPQVRFIMHPDPENPTIEVICSAKVIDRRIVVSSNGESESRYAIESPIQIGSKTWPIHITLTNRETMGYRMLLGRSAVTDSMHINPSASFLQPDLSYDLYKKRIRKNRTKRPLRIGILTQEPDNYSNRKMIEAASARGHVIECIEDKPLLYGD